MPTLDVPFFDAHLDLAYLAVNKRRMAEPLGDADLHEPHPPAAVTLAELAARKNENDPDGGFTGVRLALGTIFTEPIDDRSAAGRPEQYPTGDIEAAHRAGRAQMEAYLTWRDEGLIDLDLRRHLRSEPGTGEIRGGMGVAEPAPPSPGRLVGRLPARPGLSIGILMENADPIRSPDEIDWWRDRGLVAVGLAWARPSRYAGGNIVETGLSDLGRELVKNMDRLRIVHDVSHLSDRAFDDLMELTGRPVMASHSNCRALLGDPAEQRHLTDAQIRRIVERGGVIGLNLFSRFLDASVRESGRAPLESCVRHVEHVCLIAGDRRHIGLGSDMDGGFSADRLPEGIDRPADLVRLLESLRDRGWSDDDLAGFACWNWVRFFNRVL